MSPVLALSVCLALAPPAPTVSIDLHGLSERAYRDLDGLTLERKLTVRLIQEGFAVVSFEQPKVDIALAIVASERGWTIEARTEQQHTSRTVVPPRRTSLAETHLELAQHASQLAHELQRTLPAPERTPPATPTVEAPAPPPPPEPWLDLGVFGSALLRPGGVDPLLLVRARAGAPRIAVQLEAGLAFSSTPAITVVETQVAVGPSVAVVRGELVGVSAALEAALVLHHYALSDPYTQDPRGTRPGFGLWLPIDLEWRFPPHLALDLRLAGGWSPGVEHTSERQTLWARGAFRLEAGVGVRWAP